MRRRLIRMGAFLALGVTLQAGAALFAQPEVARIEITSQDVQSLADAFERRSGAMPSENVLARLIDQEIDDRLMIREARQRGWHVTDPVVQRRLIMNQRFVAPDDPRGDAELLAEAYEQGMDETDTIVRRRLIERMRLAIAERVRADGVEDLELERYRAEHADEFRRPTRVAIQQIFLSSDRRGDELERDAAQLAARLADPDMARNAADTEGDPSLLPREIGLASASELDRRFGGEFGAGALAAPIGEWTGPLRSSYGLHFVRVMERIDSELPALSEIGDRVRSRWLREREVDAVARALSEMRARARVFVEGRERRKSGPESG